MVTLLENPAGDIFLENQTVTETTGPVVDEDLLYVVSVENCSLGLRNWNGFCHFQIPLMIHYSEMFRMDLTKRQPDKPLAGLKAYHSRLEPLTGARCTE